MFRPVGAALTAGTGCIITVTQSGWGQDLNNQWRDTVRVTACMSLLPSLVQPIALDTGDGADRFSFALFSPFFSLGCFAGGG